MKLVITDEATADLREIADWIAADNPRRALRLLMNSKIVVRV
jgi:plasmid stabilization system protein ParE